MCPCLHQNVRLFSNLCFSEKISHIHPNPSQNNPYRGFRFASSPCPRSPWQQPWPAGLASSPSARHLDRAAWQGTFAETFLLAEKTSNPDNIEYEAMCKDI